MNRQKKLPYLILLAFAILPAAAEAEIGSATEAKTEVKTLGRLFYTPEQRIQLERLKNRPGQAEMTISNIISVNGIVQRKGGGSGGSVVWINGVVHSGESTDGLLAGGNIASDSAPVRLPGASKPVRLKVGQGIDLNSGAVSNIGTAPAAGRDVSTGENEQANPSSPRPAQEGRVKPASPDGKTE